VRKRETGRSVTVGQWAHNGRVQTVEVTAKVSSKRSHGRTKVAVAVDSRRRHQRGEAVEQLEWGQALRAAAAGARFRGVVDEVLAVEFAQPVQGERRAGAVAQQPLAPGAVGGREISQQRDVGCGGRRVDTALAIVAALVRGCERLSGRNPALLDQVEQGAGLRIEHRLSC
jgi:hypothetical protein